MKRMLNTLFVTTQGSYLSRDGETVRVQADGETKRGLPVHTLDGIVCLGRVSCSPGLMKLCADHKVTVSFLSMQGRFWARVSGPVSGNVLLRREQYRWADDAERAAGIAKAVVIAKIANSRIVLLRALRDHKDNLDDEPIRDAVRSLAVSMESAHRADSMDALRGFEGEASRTYFEVFDHVILAQKDEFFFRERSRRPPLDNMNALLSFLYTLLAHDVVSALETVGLDPAVGFLHRDRPGRPGLALDLMEEFRPIFADRVALSLVNRQQVRGKGFKKTEAGGVLMDDETRKVVLVTYQQRKREEVMHPFIKEKMALGLFPFAQALLLARCIRGDLDGYPPFFWK